MTLPDRDLTQAEVATFWGADRAALSECVAAKTGIIGYTDRLSANLAAASHSVASRSAGPALR